MNFSKIRRYVTPAAILAVTTAGSACGPTTSPAKSPEPEASARPSATVPPPASSSGARPDETKKNGKPYQLNRQVYQISLSYMPLTRMRCWLSRKVEGKDGNNHYDDSRTVEWDPASSAPPIRYVSINNGTEKPTLRCSAEPVQIQRGTNANGTSTYHTFSYVFEAKSGTATDATGEAVGELHGPVGEVVSVPGKNENGAPKITVTYNRMTDYDPELGGVDTAISRNRSLDPLTPIATELLKVIAEVAVDRAKANATAAIKEILLSSVCTIQYSALKTDTGSRSSAELYFPRKNDAKDVSGIGEHLFSRVCRALHALRIEEIASSSQVLARALAGDLTEYAFRFARARQEDEGRALLFTLEPIVVGLIEGKAIGTERDFQTMLLRLGSIKIVPSAAKADQKTVSAAAAADKDAEDKWWPCGIGIGFAVVRECLRREACTAEQLLSSFKGELENPTALCKGATDKIEANWPELRSILARSIDVFRPPPGISPNQTAKVATNIVLDVLKTGIPQDLKGNESSERRLRDFETVRALINSVFDKDVAAGVIAASGLITSAIDAECPKNNNDCAVTSDELKKGVAVLNGFVSYASTYKEGVREGEESKTDAEREKLRHEERRKAMESLIDTVTDRSNRGGRWVASVGVSAGFAFGRWPVGNTPSLRLDYSGVPAPSLPIGFGLQLLPGDIPVGVHAQLSFLDLAQYASLDKEGKTADLKVENALFCGAHVGLLFGNPRYSLLVSGELGYSPALRFEGTSRPGVIRGGVFFGTYVPLFDFN
jgi:hypothetical protein